MCVVLNSVSSVQYVNNSMENAALITKAIPEPSPLMRNDAIKSTIPTGEVPAIKQGLVGKMTSGAASAVNTTINTTINATKEVGNVIANEVLPKPEPLSTKLIRNKFLSAVLVGGFVNGIHSLVKVAKGEIAQEEAGKQVVKSTGMGAVAGLSFASGMGFTASTIGKFVGGVPLSILGLTFGTLASIAAVDLVQDNVDFFSKTA